MEDQMTVLYFGTFDADGWPVGFFPSDVWPDPPAEAIEITEPQYRELLKGGCVYVDGEVVEAPPRPPPEPGPEPVPQTLSRRQFFQQAAIDGMITDDEAFAAVTTGTIPPPMQDYVDSLPVEEQFNAKMLFGGAQAFERNAEITSDFGNAKGMTDDEIDQFFIDGAHLTA